jgi:hypothetical protein
MAESMGKGYHLGKQAKGIYVARVDSKWSLSANAGKGCEKRLSGRMR